MRLTKLLESLNGDYKLYGNPSVNVSSICDDSRKCKKSCIFIAISGLHFDAHEFISDAIKRGAVAVLGETDPKKEWLKKITYIKVPNSRKALALLSSAWYGNPSEKLKIIGVTGTDGKTTTASILYWILKKSGLKVGMVTSVSAKLGDHEVDTGFHVTNPEPIILHKFLAEMVKRKIEYAVLEVTSHGLSQYRVWGIPFEIGVLTNITPEHLDYHKTMEEYVKAKSGLFKVVTKAVLNRFDSSFGKIRKYIPKSVKIITYPDPTIDLIIRNAINNKFPETYNRFNAEAACITAREYGVRSKDIVSAILTFPKVKGRLEEVSNKLGVKIYIDFAHTPNALKNVLGELKKHTKGKLISVFGCAGERDIKKRPVMGEISSRFADISIFTAEDPRNEFIGDILEDMICGAKKTKVKEILSDDFKEKLKENKKVFLRIPERGEAIFWAVRKLAGKGDTIVICGKGHEKSMAYGKIEYPWSDKEAVEDALKGKIKKIER